MGASQFFNSLDNMISRPANESGRRVIRKSAKEELDKNSSQEEFIAEFADAVAKFILNSRAAFDLDDATALDEYVGVLQVDEVKERILHTLANPPEDKEDIVVDDVDTVDDNQDNQDSQDANNAPASSNNEDSDLVSEDVMKLLDE